MQTKRLRCMPSLLVLTVVFAHAQSNRTLSSKTAANSQFGNRPLTFEVNQGQAASEVSYISRATGYTAFLTNDGMVLALRASHARNNPGSADKHAILQFKLVGSSKTPLISGEDQRSGVVNYFIGRNPAGWHRNVSNFGRVRYKNIYPGIDLLYYGNQRQIEYDFEVGPGADPRQIRFEIDGASQIGIAPNGNLAITTAVGELSFQPPSIYQNVTGRRLPVKGNYVLDDSSHVRFQVDAFDSEKPLVIDPVLVYSTYFGGSGDDEVQGVAVDSAGDVYVAGSSDSTDLPLTAMGSLSAGNIHAFVAKLDPTGSNLIFCDFIGGNGQDYGFGVAVDASRQVYITGSTVSSDFPLVQPFQGTYPGSYNAFLSKISIDGSSLMYSTYFGGNGLDVPAGVAVDDSGNMIIAGYTSSTNLPVSNAYQASASSNQGGLYGNYGFVTKFNPSGSALIYSTYLAGNSNVISNCGGTPCWGEPQSTIYGLAIDAGGNAYVGGSTNTYNFPTTPGSYSGSNQTAQNGNAGFVSKFDLGGNLLYSTYLGGDLMTEVEAIAVDGTGAAYLTGLAVNDGTFPVTPGTICDPAIYSSGCTGAFVTKVDAAGATLLYSTFLGPNNNAVALAIALDANNDAYIATYTGIATAGLVSPIENFNGSSDILLIAIDPAATTELFSTYLGAGSSDVEPVISGITLDARGNIYVAGITNSPDLPVTESAFQAQAGGNLDGFVLKIATTSSPAVSMSPTALSFAAQAVGSTSQPSYVAVYDMGSAPLSVSSIVANGDFSETDNCGSNVVAAGTCTLSISFTPTAVGPRTGTVVIQDDAVGSPHTIPLSGSGLGPYLEVTPASLTFPAAFVGTSSAAQSVSLANIGSATINIADIQVTGDFAQSNNCSSVLIVGAHCSVNVTFTPTASGPHVGSLTIQDDTQASPHTVTLGGTGLQDLVSVSPSALIFGDAAVGVSSVAQVVSVTNTGNTTVNITTIQVAGDYKESDDCPKNLPIGASCAINVTFTPTLPGPRGGSIAIQDDAAGSPQLISLSGAGIGAQISINPSSLLFPNTPVGASSSAQTATLTNTGGTALAVSNIQTTGDYLQNNNCPASLSPGSTCSISVTFTPQTSGLSSGVVLIRDDAAGAPHVVSLSGSGVQGNIAVSPSNLTFPAVPVGTSSTSKNVTVANNGSAPVTLSSIQVAGDYATTNNCTGALAPGSSCLVNVTFTPTSSGNRTGTLSVGAGGPGVLQSVALTGVGSDFSLSSSSSTATIQSGSSATYAVQVSPLGGNLPGAIALSCSGAPPKSACTLSSNSVSFSTGPVSVTVTISPVATSAVVVPAPLSPALRSYALWLPLQSLGLIGLALTASKGRLRRATVPLILAVILAISMMMTSCAGGTGVAPQQPGPTGTTPGTYAVLVSGTSGGLQHSLPLTLTVH